MLSATLAALWVSPVRDDALPAPPKNRSGPVFIGDAVQPWGEDTMLLALLRRDAENRQP